MISAPAGFSSGTISVIATNCKGNSAAKTKTVYGATLSAPSFSCGNSGDNFTVGVCAGSTQEFEICTPTGATSVTWSAPAGAVISDGVHTGNPITETSGNPNHGGEFEVDITFPSNFVSGTVTVYATNDLSLIHI